MTAICYDGYVIAADRKATSGDILVGYRKKIFKWSRGIFAFSGPYGDEDDFREWLEADGSTKIHLDKKFSALYTKDGTVYFVDSDFKPYKAFAPWGIGSGGEACEVLMRQGYKAEEAVKAVAKFNATVGGKVDTYIVRPYS